MSCTFTRDSRMIVATDVSSASRSNNTSQAVSLNAPNHNIHYSSMLCFSTVMHHAASGQSSGAPLLQATEPIGRNVMDGQCNVTFVVVQHHHPLVSSKF